MPSRMINGLNYQPPGTSVVDFWSGPLESINVALAANTLALPDVVVADLPAAATITRAIVIFKFRLLENLNLAVNRLDGATVPGVSQVIQINDAAATGWTDAINFVDLQFGVEADTRENGDVLLGSIDVSGLVVGNDTYSLRWLLAKAVANTINFNDCACGIRVWYDA